MPKVCLPATPDTHPHKMIVDTHTHIYDSCFDEDIAAVIDRARQKGVEKILLPNIDKESIEALHRLADKYPGYCLPMMGLHPSSVTQNWEEDLRDIKKQFQNNTYNYIGVGEIGIDLYWDKTLKDEQMAAFEEQLRWSIEYDLPVSIHSRESISESIGCIQNIGTSKLRGVFHSFGGTADDLRNILELGNFYIGVNGTVTYKNSTLPASLSATSLAHIIIETDAPYLPPVPYRGKRNEPSYTTYIVEKLSDIYGVSREEVESITTQNAKRLYNIKS